MSLKRIVRGDAGSGVGLRFCGVADVGDPEVDVSAFESLLIGLAVRKIDGAKAAGRGDNRIAVSVVLFKRGTRPNGIGRRGNPRLVERKRNDFMAAEIADVSDI